MSKENWGLGILALVIGGIMLLKKKAGAENDPGSDPETEPEPDPGTEPEPDPEPDPDPIPGSPYDVDLLSGYLDSDNRMRITIRNNRVDTSIDQSDIEDGAKYWVISFDCYYVLTNPKDGQWEVHTGHGSADVRLPAPGGTKTVSIPWPAGGSDNWGSFAQNLVRDGYIPGRYSFTGHIWIYPRARPAAEILYSGDAYGNSRPLLVDPEGLILGRA